MEGERERERKGGTGNGGGWENGEKRPGLSEEMNAAGASNDPSVFTFSRTYQPIFSAKYSCRSKEEEKMLLGGIGQAL